jgi:Holliday junction resolvase RusA-like endonuclease
MISFVVSGMVPAPQGSKRHLGNGVMVESCKRVKPWRYLVLQAALETGAAMIRGPVFLHVIFLLPRPKGHYGKRGLRPSAPAWPAVRPDLSKLVRSTEDALSGVIWEDDSRVVQTTSTKLYCRDGQLPGAVISVSEAPLPGPRPPIESQCSAVDHGRHHSFPLQAA